MNNNISNFLNKQNIKLLWDVLLDELHIDIKNKTIVSNIRTVFESNINPFTSRAVKSATDLVDLNKQFLAQVVTAVNRLFPNLKQEQNFKRINISSEDIQIYEHEPYKVEDIQNVRQSVFEKQVNQKRIEFENSISLKKPQELDFSEKVDDGKIKEMDALIAETMARRNFEVEQYHSSLTSNSVIDSEKWLQPTETSVNPTNKEKHKYEQKIKYTNTNTNNDLSPDPNISLVIEENNNSLQHLTSDMNSIFNKIKKINTNNTVNTNHTNHTNNDEFTKQIADLNAKYTTLNNKMDLLIELVTKLTK